ncbi:hypothetical protein [Sagittula salina]|uniref:Uncharacterized protein n=1 Tax=Sagittula salina TaxID=2820268 RepID=A0A940MT39_9RHOB|nr:hypothetical protein [Sagittula salina]MBP0482474.1 hypothetical protein [Sagittula salina]
MPSETASETPFEPGGWVLWEDGQSEVVLDTDPHVGFAYLYQAGDMVSSVWLFNLPGPQPDPADMDALPGMPAEFLIPTTRAPRVLEDLDVLHDRDRWTIRWGEARAVLKPGATPGYHSDVTSFTPFARPIEDLPL